MLPAFWDEMVADLEITKPKNKEAKAPAKSSRTDALHRPHSPTEEKLLSRPSLGYGNGTVHYSTSSGALIYSKEDFERHYH
jgi:hypothetical protein